MATAALGHSPGRRGVTTHNHAALILRSYSYAHDEVCDEAKEIVVLLLENYALRHNEYCSNVESNHKDTKYEYAIFCISICCRLWAL